MKGFHIDHIVPLACGGKSFSLGGFSCGLTIENLKLKNSSGHGPGKKNLQQKQNENDLQRISPILEESTKKIKISEISNSNFETSESEPTNDQKKIQDLQTTSTNKNSKFLTRISSTCWGKKLIPKFWKKNQKSKTRHKNSITGKRQKTTKWILNRKRV
jgi:hypothetical protein